METSPVQGQDSLLLDLPPAAPLLTGPAVLGVVAAPKFPQLDRFFLLPLLCSASPAGSFSFPPTAFLHTLEVLDNLEVQSCAPLRRHSHSAPACLLLDKCLVRTASLHEKLDSLSVKVKGSGRDYPATSIMAVKRCTVCHMYIDGAPTPDLAHVGQFGPSCTSEHHPKPCVYSHRETGTCTFYEDVDSVDSVETQSDDKLTKSQLQARDKTRQQELDKMAAELVSFRNQQVEMDRMSNDMREMKDLLKSFRPPVVGGSLAPQTSSPVSTGASSLSPSQDLSSLGAHGGAGLDEDVTRHIQKNRVPAPSTLPVGSYTGPTMPDLRKDDELNKVAMKVLAVLSDKIPQIRETFTVASNHQHLSSQSFQPGNAQSRLTTDTRVSAALDSRPTASPSVVPQFQPPVYGAGSSDSEHPAYSALHGLGGGGADGGAHASASGAHGGQTSGPQHPEDNFMDASQIMQLCTVSNRRQLRPHEFARMGRFSYASKINDKNITVPLYVMGYLQYVVALLKGVAPAQSGTEVIDRLTNLMTIMEITANNSTLDDFKCPGWAYGLEYGNRVFHDIEYGRIRWDDLADGLQPHTFLYAKDTVDMQLKGSRGAGGDRGRGAGGDRGRGRGRGGRGRGDRSDNQEGNKVCQSYNGFYTGNGCAFEFNYNRKCGYDHYCSNCFERTGAKENHKAYYCTHTDGKGATGVTGGVKATVTSG